MVIQQDTSYSSPYSIGILDAIPPPVLKLLVCLGPLISYVRQGTDIIQWQSRSPRQSLLTLMVWNVLCLWTWQALLVGIPALILHKLCTDWLRFRTSRTRRDRLERARLVQLEKQRQKDHDHDHEDDERLRSQRQQQQREAEQEELIARKIQPEGQVSLDDTLDHVEAIVHFANRVMVTLDWVRRDYLDGSRPEVLVASLSALVYLIPIWCGVVFWLGAHGVLALVGSLALVAYSPWTPVLVLAVRRQPVVRYVVVMLWSYAVALITSWKAFAMVTPTSSPPQKTWKRWLTFVGKRAKKEKQEVMDKLDDPPVKSTRNEMVFQFEIYENQRWWLGANWTTNMLSTERAPWTDNRLVSIGSKEEFKLPETTTTDKQRKTWSWADNDWWVDMTGELDRKVDHSGWEYGNNAWQHLTGRPAIQTFTRRRRWCRRALLIEHRPLMETKSSNQASGLRQRS